MEGGKGGEGSKNSRVEFGGAGKKGWSRAREHARKAANASIFFL